MAKMRSMILTLKLIT